MRAGTRPVARATLLPRVANREAIFVEILLGDSAWRRPRGVNPEAARSTEDKDEMQGEDTAREAQHAIRG